MVYGDSIQYFNPMLAYIPETTDSCIVDQRECQMLCVSNSSVTVVLRKRPAMQASIIVYKIGVIITSIESDYNTYHATHFFKKCFCHVGFLSNLAKLSMAPWSKKAVLGVFHYESIINHQLEMVEIFQISNL
jgi:hypothetical protein